MFITCDVCCQLNCLFLVVDNFQMDLCQFSNTRNKQRYSGTTFYDQRTSFSTNLILRPLKVCTKVRICASFSYFCSLLFSSCPQYHIDYASHSLSLFNLYVISVIAVYGLRCPNMFTITAIPIVYQATLSRNASNFPLECKIES